MERRYSEEEMRAVFAKAAERQRRAETVDAGEGLSLAEMQEVAAAAGIDPTHVAAAVAEIAAAPEPRKTFIGVPVEVVRVRRLSAPVSEEAWALVVSELRRTFNDDGVPSQLGRIREWSAIGRGPRRDMTTRLALEPDGEGARVTLRQSAKDFAFGFTLAASIQGLLSVVFSVLAAAGVDNELWIPAGIMGGMALMFMTAVQVGMRVWARRQERRFESVLDRIELIALEDAGAQAAVVETHAPRTAHHAAPHARAPEAPPPPALDLDDLPDAPEDEEAERRRERLRSDA